MIDTLSLLTEYDLVRFDSRHRLVIAASQRAKHLLQGARATGHSRFTKPTTTALDEVMHGHVEFLIGEAAKQAIKDIKRGKESEVERMAVQEITEDAREIKKELSVYVDDSASPPEPTAEE